MAKKIVDTNILLNYPDIINNETDIVIPTTVISELESIKASGVKSEEIRCKARHAVRTLQENPDKYEPYVVTKDLDKIIEQYNVAITNDTYIICSCLVFDDSVLITNDLCMELIAKNIFNVNVQNYCNSNESGYKGYELVSGNSSYINSYMEDIDLSKFYINEYLLIHNTDDDKTTEMRFDGKSFVGLKLPSSNFIKAKNSLQRCALDMLMNQNITTCAILGTYGSGKTYLTTKMAIYNVVEKGNQAKIVGIREPVGEGKDIGYLTGDFDDKTQKFFDPFSQQLDGGEFELQSLKQRGMIETQIPYYSKGSTYDASSIIVDEAEDLSEKQIKLIGTRVGKDSQIYFSGDYKQSINNTTQSNPLVKMCNNLKGNPLFACIFLEEDVRSETSKMFANLFE